jgi:hypothetical protein
LEEILVDYEPMGKGEKEGGGRVQEHGSFRKEGANLRPGAVAAMASA